jgi:hypothetical protein
VILPVGSPQVTLNLADFYHKEASADRISIGNSNTHTPKRGVAIPDNNAPITNPAQIPAERRALYRCVSQDP